jgi:hypothetical protein
VGGENNENGNTKQASSQERHQNSSVVRKEYMGKEYKVDR